MEHKFKIGDIVTWNKRSVDDTTLESVKNLCIITIDEKYKRYEVQSVGISYSESKKLLNPKYITFDNESEFDLVKSVN